MTIDRRKLLGLLGLSGAAASEAAAATIKGLHDGPVSFAHGQVYLRHAARADLARDAVALQAQRLLVIAEGQILHGRQFGLERPLDGPRGDFGVDLHGRAHFGRTLHRQFGLNARRLFR